MSSKFIRVRTFTAIASLVVATSYSVPVSAAALTRAATAAATTPTESSLPVFAVPLAMMDDMDMMESKGRMGSTSPGRMKGNMPPGAPASADPSGGPTADPMADPSTSDAMGCMGGCMGRPSTNVMAATSRLPGFPGASHLYHVGATSFFLDHPQHITLSIDQQTALNRVREKALLDRTAFDRRIAEAEQELWTLTAADTPDAARIEAQVRTVEKLRGDQRMAFIRAVGEASQVLTADQRASVLGMKPPATGVAPGSGKPMPSAAKPAAHGK